MYLFSLLEADQMRNLCLSNEKLWKKSGQKSSQYSAKVSPIQPTDNANIERNLNEPEDDYSEKEKIYSIGTKYSSTSKKEALMRSKSEDNSKNRMALLR